MKRSDDYVLMLQLAERSGVDRSCTSATATAVVEALVFKCRLAAVEGVRCLVAFQ